MSIVVLFVVLFSSYLAISINYSKAFKVKNFILSTIERREGYTKSLTDTSLDTDAVNNSETGTESAQSEINSYLKDFGYYTNVIKSGYCEKNGYGKTMSGGYCVKRVCNEAGTGTSNYYKVTTFMRIEFPLITFALDIPISGETKLIYYDSSDIDCDSGRGI